MVIDIQYTYNVINGLKYLKTQLKQNKIVNSTVDMY